MTSVQVNGKYVWFKANPSRFDASYIASRNKIIKSFASIGITESYIHFIQQKSSVTVEWQVNGEQMKYSCSSQYRAEDNIGCIAKVIENDCYAIRKGMKTFGQVMQQFMLTHRAMAKSAYEILGVFDGCKDKTYIEYKFKQLAKEFHPDNKETGNSEKFKEINEAYQKIMKEV